MRKVGVIGLGDMGSGLALNLLKAGFEVHGFDLSEARQQAFAGIGGILQGSAADVGREAEAVFVMVMNGAQAREVIVDGLATTMVAGGIVLLTATIRADEARSIADELQGTGLCMIDSPVSGGFPGAQSGTLTMMASADDETLSRARPVMKAVSKVIHHVGHEPGMGQTVKAVLQSLIGSVFTATFEASVLAAKAGVDADALYNVISTSGAGCGVANTALQNIIDRKFENTGSHIGTMYKDLTIVMDLARSLGVPMFTASTAMQLFQAGITRYPDGDNWSVTKISESIVGAGLTRQKND